MGIFDIFRKEKEKPDFSNVEGGSSSTAPNPPPPPVSEKARDTDRSIQEADSESHSEEIVHTVARGDTLWDIAERYLGEGKRWREIYRVNQGVIDDPDRIEPGMRLVIPTDSPEVSV